MKNIAALFLVALTLLTFKIYAQESITFRFNNAVVVDGGANNDTLIFDVEAKGGTANTYTTAFGPGILFNESVFGPSALPVSEQKLALSIPLGYNWGNVAASSGSNRFASSYSAWPLFPPFSSGIYNIAFLSNLTTEFQGVVRYKMLITGTGDCGVAFYGPTMSGQQFYVTETGPGPSVSYNPTNFENDLLTFPSTPAIQDLMISEVADPSDGNAGFVEIYNPNVSDINFTAGAWYLTAYDGVSYTGTALSGSVSAGSSFVIGGPSFASAYPGKTADFTTSLVENGGDVTYLLTVSGDYGSGTLMDLYDGIALNFTAMHAVRYYSITVPHTTFTPAEWNVSPATTMDMTPGSHHKTLTWDGSLNDTWRDTANWTPSYVPDVGHNASIPADAVTQPLIGSGSMASCHDFYVGGPLSDQQNKIKTEALKPDEE